MRTNPPHLNLPRSARPRPARPRSGRTIVWPSLRTSLALTLLIASAALSGCANPVWDRADAKIASLEKSVLWHSERDPLTAALASQPNALATDIHERQPVQFRGQSPQTYDGPPNNSASNIGTTMAGQGSGNVQQTTYQYPEVSAQGYGTSPSFGVNSPNIGSPNELNSIVQPYERGGNAPAIPFPANYADVDIYVTETQTGRINFGGAYNSDNGIVGQFIIDEKNFDITRFPRSLRDFTDGTAFRGAGQTFRLELVPGANVQRYLVSFAEPYLFGTDYSFSASGVPVRSAVF